MSQIDGEIRDLEISNDDTCSSLQTEMKQTIIGRSDRMPVVVEETEEGLLCNADEDLNLDIASNLLDDLDALLARNMQRSESCSDDFYSTPIEFGLIDKPYTDSRVNGVYISDSDTDTIDETEVAAEIDVLQSMGERWGETRYATVLRHTHRPHAPSPPASPPPVQQELSKLSVYSGKEQTSPNGFSPTASVSPSERPKYPFGKSQLSTTHTTHESGTKQVCFECRQQVYVLECVQAIGRVYHKWCFRCRKCNTALRATNHSVYEGMPYCIPHYMELFKMRGHYGRFADTAIVDGCAPTLLSPVQSEPEVPALQTTRELVAKFQQLASEKPREVGVMKQTSNRFSIAEQCPPNSTKVAHESMRIPVKNGEISVNTARVTNGHIGRELDSVTSSVVKVDAAMQTDVVPFFHDSMIGVTQRPKATFTAVVDSCHERSREVASELPAPGITKDLVAKFSALSSS